MTTRPASHAGSWYTADPTSLSSQLDRWLAQVPDEIEGKPVPVPGARVIIAPHAGYSYSGPAAAWAYKTLDLSNVKRVFLLGPSHVIHLSGCALSKHDAYETPLGDLKLDKATIQELKATNKFDSWRADPEESEHSLEMHCPYIYKMLSRSFKSEAEFPPLVPILVGNTSPKAEKEYGKILAPYLADPTSIFVISSDFCHWGQRFSYTYYIPESPSAEDSAKASGYSLGRRDKRPTSPPIHESIAKLDKLSMDAIEGGKHDGFLKNLAETGNTVCGRHPIGVTMAAIEILREEAKIAGGEKGTFKFIRYERSSDVEDISDSSVSYASAVAVL